MHDAKQSQAEKRALSQVRSIASQVREHADRLISRGSEARTTDRASLRRLRYFNNIRKELERILSPKQADRLAFDLMEIDEACDLFKRDVKGLVEGLKRVRHDSSGLWESSPTVAGDLVELRVHIRSALPLLYKVQEIACALLAVDAATDNDLTEGDLTQFNKHFQGGRITKEGQPAKKVRGSRPPKDGYTRRPRKK